MLLTVVALAALVALAAVFLAHTDRYHSSDALSYRRRSRPIGQTGGIWFPSISDQTYHLPVGCPNICRVVPIGSSAPRTRPEGVRFGSGLVTVW
jgi:hypothetical protein